MGAELYNLSIEKDDRIVENNNAICYSMFHDHIFINLVSSFYIFIIAVLCVVCKRERFGNCREFDLVLQVSRRELSKKN